MKIEHILFVSDKNELPYYLEDYKDITDIYMMNLNDKPETIVNDYYKFVCRSKTRYFIIAETECAFYARMITGWFRLLVNPVLSVKPEQEQLVDEYLNIWCEGDNEFENIAWFTDSNNINITIYKDIYFPDRYIVNDIIDLKNEELHKLFYNPYKY